MKRPIRTVLFTILTAALMLTSASVLVGCTAGEAREAWAKAETEAQEKREYLNDVIEILTLVQEGVITVEESIAMLDGIVPPGTLEKLRGILNTGGDIASALAGVVVAAQTDLERAEEFAAEREARYAEAQADEDATFDVIADVLNLGALLITGGTTGAIGSLIGIITGRRKGRAEVAAPIAAARASNSDVDDFFRGNAGDILRRNTPLKVRRAIEKANANAGV